MDQTSDYIWADAWYLLAVSYVSPNGQPASLTDVIGAADYINHAILSVEEIKSATFKLTRDGWIKFDSGSVSATDKMINEFTKLPAKSAMSQMALVEQWLGSSEYDGNYDPEEMTSPDFDEISSEMVDEATDAYKKLGTVQS